MNTVQEWRLNLQLFADEKTEEATPHRRQEARQKGQVARSADLNAAMGMAAVVTLLAATWSSGIDQMNRFWIWLLGEFPGQEITSQSVLYIFSTTLVFLLKLMAPLFITAVAVGLLVNLVQVGFMFTPETLKVKLETLNPLEGFRRIFSRRSLIELVKAVLKVFVVGAVAFAIVRGQFDRLIMLLAMGLPQSVALVASLTIRVALAVVAVFIAVAVLDFLFQRREFRRRLRMSKQEVKEELKQTEGDPLLRSKLREKQRQLAARRMIQSVPTATVVITNPTHLAVALRYDVKESPAPQLVAKGAGDIAKRIAEVARENNVPVIENKPVARFIYKNVEIGQEIPAELYQAVAEVLAMLARTRRKISG